MSFRLGILATNSSPYVLDLQRAAAELQVPVVVLGYPDLAARLTPNGLADLWTSDKRAATGGAELASPSHRRPLDAVIVRSMPLGSLEQVIFRMDCLQIWQAQGVALLNTPRCLETSIDKWLTLHRLSLAGLPVPPTIACQNRDQALAAFDELGKDVLVKPLFGGEGRGIIRLQDDDVAWRTCSTLQQLGQVLYLQRFIPHFGYDIRVLKIGDQLLSVRRRAQDGGFRTNVSRGAVAEPHRLTEYEEQLARRAAEAVDGAIVGIDLLPARDGGLYVLEVNAVPGWKAVARCLEVDVARLVIQCAGEHALPALPSAAGANYVG